MKNLVYKEFRLAAHPTNYIFLSFAFMLLIPNYPYLVSFFYTTLGIFFMCLSSRENHDLEYSLNLPVRKRDLVGARLLTVCIFELLTIVATIPFAVLRCTVLNTSLNQAGSMPSLAFYGIVFLYFGIFNLSFFTAYYKSPEKNRQTFCLVERARIFNCRNRRRAFARTRRKRRVSDDGRLSPCGKTRNFVYWDYFWRRTHRAFV